MDQLGYRFATARMFVVGSNSGQAHNRTLVYKRMVVRKTCMVFIIASARIDLTDYKGVVARKEELGFILHEARNSSLGCISRTARMSISGYNRRLAHTQSKSFMFAAVRTSLLGYKLKQARIRTVGFNSMLALKWSLGYTGVSDRIPTVDYKFPVARICTKGFIDTVAHILVTGCKEQLVRMFLLVYKWLLARRPSTVFNCPNGSDDTPTTIATTHQGIFDPSLITRTMSFGETISHFASISAIRLAGIS